MEERINKITMERVDYPNAGNFGVVEARSYQIDTNEALELRVVDLFQDEDVKGRRLLSRADIILIFTLYKEGIEEFLADYKKYAEEMSRERGYKFVNKPHFYLKDLIG